MQLTKQQNHIKEAAASGERLFIRALAGTGKTTSLRLAAEQIRPGLAVAFNRRIATELKASLPSSWQVKTLNALGHAALCRAGLKPRVDEFKLYRLAREMGIPKQAQHDTVQAASAARLAGVTPWASGLPSVSGLLRGTPEYWSHLVGAFPDADPNLAQELLVRSIKEALADGVIDFDDQLYISLFYRGNYPRYSTILIDEAQDLSALNIEQLAKLGAQSAQVIAAGDPYQSIYAFRGASATAIGQMVKKFRLTEAPLTVSWRCPHAVVDRWKPKIPDFVAALSNAKGKVEHAEQLPQLLPTGAVLCRNNGPLLQLALQLLEAGRPFKFTGKGFADAIGKLWEQSGENLNRARTIADARAQKARRYGGDPAPFIETYTMLETIHNIDPTVGPVVDRLLASKFGVTLSTGHKAKGLEWRDVVFYQPELLGENGQETNLRYVIETRTLDRLTLVSNPDM